MATLISFLGRSQRAGAAGSETTGYRKAVYQFSDGQKIETSYFGLALAGVVKPRRIIVLGTSSSMWDVFMLDVAEGEDAGDGSTEDEIEALMAACQSGTVSTAQLAGLKPLVAKAFGVESSGVECQVVEPARTLEEQTQLLAKLGELVAKNESLVIDVTHGFRHLPMIGLVAARFLERTRKVNVDGIFYAPLDMTDPKVGTTPVLDLRGMLKLLDWLDALAIFDATGAYHQFETLYQEERQSQLAGLLAKAAYQEHINNVLGAANSLKTYHQITPQDKASPMISLFSGALESRFSWARRPSERIEIELAEVSFLKGDYVRCASLLREGIVTRSIHAGGGDPSRSVAERNREADELMAVNKKNDIGKLFRVRNALVHGQMAENHEEAVLIRDKEKLGNFLKQVIKRCQSDLTWGTLA